MIPNYWKALIKRGDITEKDYLEKVAPCNVLIERAKKRQIEKFLHDIRCYDKYPKELEEKWEGKLKE